MNLLDRIRIERAVRAVDGSDRLTGRRARGIRQEVRANLVDAAGEVGVSQAIRNLGPLRALADSYVDAAYAGKPQPRLRTGWRWALTTAALSLIAIVAWTIGADAGVKAAGAEGTDVHLFGGLGLGVSEVGITLGILPFLGVVWLPAVVFLVASRSWRLFHVR